MRNSRNMKHRWSLFILCVLASARTPSAQDKIMVYDEQKGVIFVDKNEVKKTPEKTSPSIGPRLLPQHEKKARAKTDLHIGRKKDPPQLYFTSGLEFFEDGDYQTALKNFMYADSVQPRFSYKLWVGKTYRQLSDPQKAMSIMESILEESPRSDVADDALFEIAFHYHTSGDYEKALDAYTMLAEQYPFGKSFSNGMEFLPVAKEQRGRIRAEVINLLSILGFAGEDLVGNVRRFQKQNNLKPTGELDKKTVNELRNRSRMVLERARERSQKRVQAEKYESWLIIIGGIGIGLAVLGVILRIMARSRMQHLDLIEQSISDMGR
ncbi:MAG: tetratricopeptide repeat protein [Chitinispirillaceae bacterium]